MTKRSKQYMEKHLNAASAKERTQRDNKELPMPISAASILGDGCVSSSVIIVFYGNHYFTVDLSPAKIPESIGCFFKRKTFINNRL